MAWNDLKAAVAAVIKTNGNQEITGALLQSTLNSIIDQVGANSTYKGIATPTTNPGTPDGPVFYIATEAGTYSNFGGLGIDSITIISNQIGYWVAYPVLKVTQTTGVSTTDTMSQKAITDALEVIRSEIVTPEEGLSETEEWALSNYKSLNIGSSGLVTLSPTTRYFTYRVSVLENMILNIDLQRMISQIGSARCRLIIDMPIVRTITITNPVLWGGTPPTFASAGQYIFEIIDVDGSGTPLIWQVASTTKVELTGNILFVDSTGADYSVAQINGEIADRTTSSWVSPFKYLQNAINAAQAGDIIFVKQGIYKPTHLRTTPTVYVDSDRLNRNATFTPKNGVDIYGGFVGTETKTWQRVMDANGHPANRTILCGDILGEATVDPAKTVGDTRTDASKVNAAYNVVFGRDISALTYLNGVNVRYGNASEAIGDQASGGGIYSTALLIGINNTAYSNSSSNGGGWYNGANTNCTAYGNTAYSNSSSANGGGWSYGTNTNCTAYSNSASGGGGWGYGTNTNCTAYGNTAASDGGGWYGGANTNCTAYSNSASNGEGWGNGGGWGYGTNTNCTAYSNSASYGGGWGYGTNTNCTAYGNTAASEGGGWEDGANTNCTAYSNSASYGGGWSYGINTNCTAYSNSASYGGGWSYGINTNCVCINNEADEGVYVRSTPEGQTEINNLLYNNRNTSGTLVGYRNAGTTSQKIIFRNNAYNTAHPTISSTKPTSDIDYNTCIPNATLEQIKIEVPTVIGAATNETELQELKDYKENILTKMRPKAGSVLKGAGVNNITYPNPTDYDGTERPETSTIGILEGE